ncbi:glycoside hydrolase family 30 protein [Compostibacter hankyongensis]|uniref:Glycoside hydrolase family 30 protein n=2 Tax=Compostibacter hankyongensis TaxID=1007089 RepID=A0ABP8FNK7_9BACT
MPGGKDTSALLELRIDLADTHQTIHSFGASDCWTGKFIGSWADVSKKNRVADLLFSTDTLADGTPRGIGLSLWRFNIGAGSFEQGAGSGIATDWRREECFLNADGSYNWNKQAGQQWFLQAARSRGVKYTLGFAISPPVYMTRNGKAFHPGGDNHLNIREGRMKDYAGFLAAVAEHLRLDYLSPVNEPQWDWSAKGKPTASQAGSQATNGDIAALVKQLSAALKTRHATAKVVIGEAGQLDFLYGRNNDDRGDQVSRFFSAASPDYIGNLPDVAPVISGHSYFTTCPDDKMVHVRQQLAEKVRQVNPALSVWQSEFGILGDICGQYSGSPRNTGIGYGLYVAKVIHHDLTVANVSSWQWWLAVSPYDYSDALVYINAPDSSINVDQCKRDGVVLESKQLWALGNYARFVRPGMQRVTASIDGLHDPVKAAGALMVSAYHDPQEKSLVVVLVNVSNETKTLRLHTSATLRKNLLNTYTTDADSNLKRSYSAPDSIVVKPQSVVTLTGRYQ